MKSVSSPVEFSNSCHTRRQFLESGNWIGWLKEQTRDFASKWEDPIRALCYVLILTRVKYVMTSSCSVIYNSTLITLEDGCSRPLAGIEGSNATGKMAVCLL